MLKKLDTDDALQRTADGLLPEFDLIKDVVHRVSQHGLYAKKLKDLPLNSWEDFFSLPLTTKADLRGCNPEDTLAVPKSRIWHYHESFGTTGKPISSWYTKEDYEREADMTSRWTESIRPGMHVLNRFPYSFAVPPFILEVKCSRDGGAVLPAGYLSWNMPYPRVLEIIRRIKVEAIGCFPTEMVMLEMIADKCGYDIKKDFKSLKYILTSGRIVTPALKNYIEERWNVSLSSVYGSTEGGGVASSCTAGNLHVHHDAHIIEILNPDNWQPVEKGQTGVLVLTSYYRQGAPLIRYLTNDYCRMIDRECPCGGSEPVIQVLGRKEDNIEFAGRKVFFYDLEQAVLDFSAQFNSAVYFIIVTKKRLNIRIETHNRKKAPSENSLSELKERIGMPLKVDICGKRELFDPGFLLRAPEVYKPRSFSDWRVDDRRPVSLTEGLIKWPRVSLSECADMVQRSLKNALLRRTIQ
ncbi:MAG: AMP-binding protein [Desulfosudaceae bacterium]